MRYIRISAYVALLESPTKMHKRPVNGTPADAGGRPQKAVVRFFFVTVAR